MDVRTLAREARFCQIVTALFQRGDDEQTLGKARGRWNRFASGRRFTGSLRLFGQWEHTRGTLEREASRCGAQVSLCVHSNYVHEDVLKGVPEPEILG
jgi:hypothetical protein